MYYDLLTRIKNAQKAEHESVQAPFSKFDFAVAKVLEDSGYISNAEKKTVGKRILIEVKLKYSKGVPALTDFRIMSKPSRRSYSGYTELRPVKQGYGISILSTPEGVMSNRDARKKKVGGEYLFEIW